MSDSFAALVCITTCNRASLLKRYVAPYLAFCRSDRRFDFIVSLDGPDPESIAFCDAFGVPLVSSDEREGVGLAKNRVCRLFGDYDYYFFLEDDVELLEGQVFREHIRIARLAGFHHMSLFVRGGAREVLRQEHIGGQRVVYARYGGGQFSFFTRYGLNAVGGWHTTFAALRRFGHTEHSYRFVHRGLAEAPFIVAESLADRLLWHYPPSVTRSREVSGVDPRTQLAAEEEALIAQRLEHFPLQTLCPFRTNGMPLDGSQAVWADGVARDRYALLAGSDRRRAWADFYTALAVTQTGPAHWWSLVRAGLNDPRNARLRHIIKTTLRGPRAKGIPRG